MNSTTFLIDGFNLYHSLNDACRDLRSDGIKQCHQAVCFFSYHVVCSIVAYMGRTMLVRTYAWCAFTASWNLNQ